MLLTPPPGSLLPLVIDLDGTLIRTDTFHEMMWLLLFHKPYVLFLLPFWFLKSRAYAKARIVDHTNLSPQHLPYNEHVLAFAEHESKQGRRLVLATGTDQRLAQKIAEYVGLFQEVIGSNGHVNMTGPRKAQALVDRFGPQGFDYAGDSSADLAVWRLARKAIVVCPKWCVLSRLKGFKKPEQIRFFL